LRPIETLLLLANLLTFTGLALPLPRATGWMGHSAPVALLAAGTQILAEGPRWQMIPAYALTGLLFLIWLWRVVATGHIVRGRAHGLAKGLAIGLGLLTMGVSIALPNVFPVFRFPHPNGPYAIGTLTYHWIDTARLEAFGAHPHNPRELMVQIWYPAAADSSPRRAPYMQDADLVTSAFARIHSKPALVFGHFKFVTTNAIPSAPVADAQANYPVLLFLEGVTGFRQMNTYQVEHLVSHGYIVAAIDQPGAAADVVFPDGRQVTGMTLSQVHASIDSSYIAEPSAPRWIGRVPTGVGMIRYFAQDAVFAMEQLAALNRTDPNGILSGKLNLQRVGAFGVSLGGIAVAEACHLEPRLKACLMMDAPMPTDVVESGLQQPSMWITRDADAMRLERQWAGGWSETEIQAHQSTMRAVYLSLPGAGYFVQVPGMFHSNFTDIPNWSPWTTQMRLTGPIDGQRGHDIVNAYSHAFFDRHLLNRTAGQLDATTTRYPEAQLESRRP
jgi:Platelet-activating factor acetylhydrolase, isoform II